MTSLLLLLVSTLGAAPQVGRQVDDFTLDDHRGKEHRLSDYSDREIVVLAFLGTECPLAKLYGPRLADMSKEYQSRGVTIVGINANAQDSLTEIAAYVRRHEIDFPMLKDIGNRVADQVGAIRTPEVFVLDRDRIVRYWGRIDDQFGVGYAREKPTTHELKDAIDRLLAKRAIAQPSVESVGCYIGRVREASGDSDVTYSQDVARILQKHCVECHREREIAPFTLTEYDEVSGWAETILEVIDDKRMPPWHANPEHGSFTNSRVMSDDEKRIIREWVEAGAPQGDPSDLPESREYLSGWRLPRLPDQIVAMGSTPFVVPADETVEYQYFVVDPKLKKDTWVSAAEVIPGNRAVVHHAIVFIRPPGQVKRDGLGWLAAYVPGQSTTSYLKGQAIFVPAGSKFVFQMHYTPIGTEQSDLTKVGLIFADPEEVQERALTMVAIDRNFEIPPHAENHEVRTWFDRFPKNARLLAIAPHMHLRGKAFRFVLHHGQRQEVLLDVPNYDFNWQHAYMLETPIELQEGMRIECIANFDNSENNLVNPDPEATVRWGDQTWEEMVVAYFGVAVPKEQEMKDLRRREKSLAERRQNAEQAAQKMFERFDKNQDDAIGRKEVPESFRVFAFRDFDHNSDGRITRDEARRRAFQMQAND